MSNDRERMLARIRAGLEQSRKQLAELAAQADHTPPSYVHPPADDLVEQFCTELVKLAGRAYTCADDQAALEILGQVLDKQQADRVITWDFDQINWQGLPEYLAQRNITRVASQVAYAERSNVLQAMEPAQVCISATDLAIAESGSLVVRGGPKRGRLASLLAPVHVAIVRREQLVRGLGEAIAEMKRRHGDIFADSSSLTLITGPSRTADIEMTLTHGVHGPREIHVIIVG